MNPFKTILEALSEDTRTCLQWVVSDQLFHPGRTGQARHLQVLSEKGLVSIRSDGHWEASWLGLGVVNWHRQTKFAGQLESGEILGEPRANENGHSPPPKRGLACDDFREQKAQPGLCWCMATRCEHASAYVQAALSLLRMA